MLRSSALLLVAGLLVSGGATTAYASCMEEIPGQCVQDLRDEWPLKLIFGD